MGGSSGDTQTIQRSDPWEGVQPHLRNIFSQAENLFQQGRLANLPFPAQRAAPMTPAQESAIQGLATFGQTPLYQDILQGMGGPFRQGVTQQPVATAGAFAPMGQGSDIMLGFEPQGAQTAAQFGMAQQGDPIPQAFDPSRFGQQSRLLAGGGRAAQIMAGNELRGLLSGDTDFSNVEALTEAATRPAMRQFREQILPGISHQAAASGQIGGSREDIAEGIAARGMQDLIGDTAARFADAERQRALQAQQAMIGLAAQQGLAGQQLGLSAEEASRRLGLGAEQGRASFGLGLGQLETQSLSDAARLGLSAEQMRAAQGQGLGQLALQQQQLAAGIGPQLMQMGMLPYQSMLQAGGLQQQNIQRQISDLADRYETLQRRPMENLANYASLIQPGSGLGGTATSTQSQGGGLGQALSGAASGGLSMAALPLLAGNPISWPLVAAGAGAGLFGGMF